MGHDEQLSAVELAELRAATHRLLGSAFLYPEDDLAIELSAAARALGDDTNGMANFPFHGALRQVIDMLASLPEGGAQQLQEEYVGLFQVNASRPLCPLHESDYASRSAEDTGRIAGEVGRAYAAADVTISPGMAGDLPDHVGLELGYMAILCDAEAEAWKGNRRQRAAQCLSGQKAFLDEHLAHWFPRLADRLSGTATGESFYGRLAEATRAFVHHDRDLVGALSEVGFGAEQ